MTPESDQQRIDLEICRLYKHLNAQCVRNLPLIQLSNYIYDILVSFDKHCSLSKDAVLDRLVKTRKYGEILEDLLKQPQVAQRSAEWYELRKNRLTASDIAQALNKGKFGTKQQLLIKKAFPDNAPFLSNPALQWGVMFEPMALRSYTQRHHDIKVYEFGLIPHPRLECFGASPDGITEHGIMLEFKCPLRRKIDGNIPEQYELQMQGQMAVCGLNECDYVECDMQKLYNSDEYLQMIPEHETRDHGIILERLSDGENDDKYIYSPEYITPSVALEWVSKAIRDKPQIQYKVVFWKLRKINICRVIFDTERWNSLVPQIVSFWQEVEDLRKNNDEIPGIISIPRQPKTKKPKFDFISDEDDT